MTTEEQSTPLNLSWQEAIRRVLEQATEPMGSRQIAHVIAEEKLRDPSSFGATPEATVAAQLSLMLKAGVVDRPDRGIYRMNAQPNVPVSAEAVAASETEAKLTSVAAYGLYWDRDKVNWEPGRGRGNRIRLLGSPDDSNIEIDFAEQWGIYILYNRLSVMYIGRTTDSLLGRLRDHNSRNRRSARWDQFSWFGFRKVNEDGSLSDESENFTTDMLITVLEAVMIESMLPPLNDRGGDLMGTIYRQVEDPVLIKQEEDRFRRMVGHALAGG